MHSYFTNLFQTLNIDLFSLVKFPYMIEALYDIIFFAYAAFGATDCIFYILYILLEVCSYVYNKLIFRFQRSFDCC